ncbi:MAG: minor capsid protein, partial [Bacilli bacterium]
MNKTSHYWDKRASRRLLETEKASEIYIDRIKKIYEQAYYNIDNELISVYNSYSKDTGLDIQKLKELLTKKETDKLWKKMKSKGLDKYIKNNYKSRISRLEQIQAQIYSKAKLIYPKEELQNTVCYKGVINSSYYKTIYDTQMGTGFDFSFNRIDNNMTKVLLNESWMDKNYSERIWGNTDILGETVSQVVGGALISGQGIEKTSRQIRERFNVAQYYAERLVRTETNHFNNEADAMAYEDMGIDKYVFVATLDSRTSLICQEMDNKVFDYKDREEGVNFPPLHPNCRSKTRGYLGEDGEKLLKRRARNPTTGKTEVIDNTSYKNWYKKNITQYGIDKAYKMVKNKASDKEQYNRY